MQESFNFDNTHEALTIFSKNSLYNGAIAPNVPQFNGTFLWDTALIAEGLAVKSPYRAAKQITLHMSGQIDSGRVPNEVIYDDLPFTPRFFLDYKVAMNKTYASNITQPPTIVTAAWNVAKQIDQEQRKEFLEDVLPGMSAYMGWLLTERTDPYDGLVALIHPHESGMDNAPGWHQVLEREWSHERRSFSEEMIFGVGSKVLTGLRKSSGDLRNGVETERAENQSVLLNYLQSRHIKQHCYDLRQILHSGKGAVVKDVGFNVLTVIAGRSLLSMAAELGSEEASISVKTIQALTKLERSIETELYDSTTKTYHHVDMRTGQKVASPTASGLLPLLTTQDISRQSDIIVQITDSDQYWTSLPIPSVPVGSSEFQPGRYWRGGSWPFLRYQLERGLRDIDRDDIAQELRKRVLRNPDIHKYGEFNNPLTGQALGAMPFSPAAAELLLYQKINSLEA